LTREVIHNPEVSTDRLLQLSNLLTESTHDVNARVRQLIVETNGKRLPLIPSFDRQEKVTAQILQQTPPWTGRDLEMTNIPRMISDEEQQYYSYLGRFYSGEGAVLELGPWLGASTLCILAGLISNPRFRGRKLHVYDDFVWRSSWMDQCMPSGATVPVNHGDFQPLFERHIKNLKKHVVTQRCRIAPYDGNENLPALTWDGGPIEMCYVDCGRTFEVNEAWFRVLSKDFIPGRTLLVLQDWKTHRIVPVQWYNQIKMFTDSKGPALELVHELVHGSTATFLYRG
jgi:hypothetical protein